MQRPAHPALPPSRATSSDAGGSTRSLGITALVVVISAWLFFAWGVSDFGDPAPNGAPRNRSAEELSVIFVGFVATLLAGFGAMLAAWRLRRDRHDRIAQVALALGALSFAAAAVTSHWVL